MKNDEREGGSFLIAISVIWNTSFLFSIPFFFRFLLFWVSRLDLGVDIVDRDGGTVDIYSLTRKRGTTIP